MEKIGLKEAIASLRSELSESILASAGEEIRFEVNQIDLKFQVEVERKKEGSGGIKFWVISLGGKGSHAEKDTHTVSLSLKPVNQEGEPILTSSRETPE